MLVVESDRSGISIVLGLKNARKDSGSRFVWCAITWQFGYLIRLVRIVNFVVIPSNDPLALEKSACGT